MIVLGDIHGGFGRLALVDKYAPPGALIVQVGDLGYWPYLRKQWIVPEHPVYFIDGNHDHVPSLVALTEVTEVWPGLYYVPRGTILDIEGHRVGFCGGATSVDFKWRRKGMDWFDEEVVTEADVEKFQGEKVDLLITHSPPDEVIRRNFPADGLRMFDIDPKTWRDASAERIQRIWDGLGRPPLLCGHMHRSVFDGRCRILDINEATTLFQEG